VVIDGCDSTTPNLSGPDGCTFSDDIAQAAADPVNHGGFVRNVTRLMNAAKREGLISGAQMGAVVSCAAQSGPSPGRVPGRLDRGRAGSHGGGRRGPR